MTRAPLVDENRFQAFQGYPVGRDRNIHPGNSVSCKISDGAGTELDVDFRFLISEKFPPLTPRPFQRVFQQYPAIKEGK